MTAVFYDCGPLGRVVKFRGHRLIASRLASIKETTMFRKLVLAGLAAAALGATALSPTAASAHGWHGGWHGGWRGGGFHRG